MTPFLFDDNRPAEFNGEETYLTPIWDAALRRAASKMEAYTESFAAGAFAPWKKQLTAQLCHWTLTIALPLLEAQPDFSYQTKAMEAVTRRVFIDDAPCTWEQIYAEYPRLASILPTVTEDFVRHAAEVAEHIHTRRREIFAEFFPGSPVEKVAKVDTGAADLHERGRSVHIITFESGKKAVYKPRPLKADTAWTGFLSHMAGLGGIDPLYAPRLLDCGDYGFVEFVDARPVCSEVEAERFFFRCGFLNALLYAWGGNDFHSENLIARGDCPVLVDLETVAAVSFADTSEYTALSTNMPPFLSRSKVIEAGSAAMTKTVGSSANLPILNGRPINAYEYAGAVLRGFETGYTAVLQNLESLTGENSPVRLLAGCKIRYLKRDTIAYYKLAQILAKPENLKLKDDAAFLKKIAELGCPSEADQVLRYGYFPIYHEVLGEPAHIFSRMRRLNAEDQARQLHLLATVLDEPDSRRAGAARPSAAPPAPDNGAVRRLLVEKNRYWQRLLEDYVLKDKKLPVIVAERDRYQHYILDFNPFYVETLLGVLLSLSAWSVVSNDGGPAERVDACLRKMEAQLPACPPRVLSDGLLEGIAGVVTAAALIHEMTGSPAAYRLCGAAAAGWLERKPKTMNKHRDWTWALLYHEPASIFAIPLIPPDFRTDAHSRLREQIIRAYMDMDYDFNPLNDSAAPLFNYSLLDRLRAHVPGLRGKDTACPESAFARYQPMDNDNLCFGNAGAVSALLDRGFHLKALAVSTEAARNAAAEGRFRLNTRGYFPFPSFFYGESGVLYTLARVLAPDKVPSLWRAV